MSTPSFRLRDLPRLLRENSRNRLTSFGVDGKMCARPYSDVYADVMAARAGLVARGLPLNESARAVVAGPPGYDWLVGALACLFSGVEVIALPETLEEADATASLQGLPFDFAITQAKMAPFGVFAQVPRVPLEGFGAPASGLAVVDLDESPRFSIVAFTSGSTARAKLKSFRVTAESTAAFTEAFIQSFSLRAEDNWVVCHSFSHVVHFEYVLGGLGWGYDVTLADPLRVLMNGAELRPSALVSVPSVYEQLATVIERRGGDVTKVLGDRLKVLIIGAAPSSAELQRRLCALGLPLYEGYGMSETNMIACNLPACARPGTVGAVWPGISVALDDEGVILARAQPPRADGYLNVSAEESAATFLAGGWVRTGDLGAFEDGSLKIIGRLKEIVVTSGGEKVNAAAIEARLRELPEVGHALVFGERRPYVVAVFAPREGGSLPSEELLRTRLEEMNRSLPHHERVLGFLRLPAPLDVDSGLLTRSFKPRRSVIEERYAREIAALYA
ncbi:MAG TPA: AMP-binding protein [Polyangiaceae bacterium]|jgi:long-subunit acyl-CoA synthetase (AMP-forming)